ncbi:MAG: glycosyltransferase [Pseudomonadota bacterium]
MPRSSIIVPSYNRPAALRACLGALVLQDAGDFDIVVVDDGSPAPLAPVCADFVNVRCIRQDNAGPAAARNRGAREADAQFLAFTDDDCKPRPGWLAALRAAQGDDAMRLVGGQVENGLPQNAFATASQDICDFLYDWFGASAGGMPFFTSNNIGCAADRFQEIGGFDETFPRAAAEDREFGIRWRETGGHLRYAPDAIIDHFHAMTLRRYWRQHANYGHGAHHLHTVLSARGSDLPRAEPAAFYAGLVTRPMREHGVIRGAGSSVLAAISQAAMVVGYLSYGRR